MLRRLLRPIAHGARSVLGINGLSPRLARLESSTRDLLAALKEQAAIAPTTPQTAPSPADHSCGPQPSAMRTNGTGHSDVEVALSGSPEFRSRLQRPDHPLAKQGVEYSEEDVSYFMHRGRFRPLAISVETINICNNDCIICPYSAQTRKRRTMAMDLFEKAIRDYQEIGGGPVSLTPLVGEAFLDKHLLRRLRFMKQAPSITKVSVTTNGGKRDF